jgi:hypothetical protein
MTIDAWLEFAVADARSRGLALDPLVRSLAEATRQLRAADWNDDARGGEGQAGRVGQEGRAGHEGPEGDEG